MKRQRKHTSEARRSMPTHLPRKLGGPVTAYTADGEGAGQVWEVRAPSDAEAYLEHVRRQPCMAPSMGSPGGGCEGDTVPHHEGPSPMGGKVSDFLTVPLCFRHHRIFHDTGKLWPWDAVGTRFAMLEWQARSLSEWLEAGR